MGESRQAQSHITRAQNSKRGKNFIADLWTWVPHRRVPTSTTGAFVRYRDAQTKGAMACVGRQETEAWDMMGSSRFHHALRRGLRCNYSGIDLNARGNDPRYGKRSTQTHAVGCINIRYQKPTFRTQLFPFLLPTLLREFHVLKS